MNCKALHESYKCLFPRREYSVATKFLQTAQELLRVKSEIHSKQKPK